MQCAVLVSIRFVALLAHRWKFCCEFAYLVVACNCRSHSEATMQQRVVITVARVHGLGGVSCVIFVSFLHVKIINLTIHNFICHNSSSFYISAEAVALSFSSQKIHINCLMSAEIRFDLRKHATL